VPPGRGNIHSRTQRKPHLAWGNALGKRFISAFVTQLNHDQIAQERTALASSEFFIYGDKEFASGHTKNLANRQVRIELGYQFIRQGIGNRGTGSHLLEDRQPISYLVKNVRQGHIESLGDRSKNFTRCLFLSALYFTQVTQRNIGAGRNLAQRGTLLLAEVAKNIAYFVSH